MRLGKELTLSSPNLRQQTFSPNHAIGFLHLRPVLLISPVFPSLPLLILFMTCATKRGSQLSSAKRTLVFCSAEIRRVLHCRFTYLTAIFHTTVGHVITPRWSLRNHFHSNTCVNHRILECFRAGFIIAFQNDSAKTKDETQKKFNGVCCGTFPFTTCRSRLNIPAVSTHQNWKRVCVFLCKKTVIESCDRSRPFSLLFFQQFNSMVSTNTSTFGEQHTNSCRQHVLNLQILVSLCSLDSLDSF